MRRDGRYPRPMLASLDGAIGPLAETRIPVTDEGLLRGDGGFEVARLYGGRPFAMEDHYARLQRTCNGLRLEFDLTALRREVDALLEEAGPIEGLLRIVLTRGGRRLAMIEPLPHRLTVARVMTVPYAPNRVLDGLKTLSYAGNVLAGPTWTFFWVADGRLLTPPLEDRILDSITRARVIEETAAQEAVCTMDDVRGAEEAFIASSVREVMPIAAVDDIELPSAPGPVTQDARERLAKRVERELGAPA